jgi:uncharacterized SAM-binding protein YcdF (DUF218 family)
MTMKRAQGIPKPALHVATTLAALGAVVVIVALVAVLLTPFLVINAPEHADVILVLEGDRGDLRYWSAVGLLRKGYASRIVLDADAAVEKYGRSPVESATEFVNRTTPGQSSVCPINGESTDMEAREVAPCLARLNVHSVLLVTSEFHTRRAISIFRKRLPQYHWSVAAALDPDFSNPKERGYRERRKIAVMEWEKFWWWKVVDQWRARP